MTAFDVPKAASGKPPPIDFARQIMSGFTPKYSRRAAPAELGAGLHFVEDQQRAVLIAEFAQPFEEAGLRHAEADVHHDRLENDCRDFAGKLLEAMLDAAEIVEAGDGDVADAGLGNAKPAGNGVGRIEVADSVAFGFTLTSAASCRPW